MIANVLDFRTREEISLSQPKLRTLHDPRKEILVGSALAAFLFLGIGGWSLVARLDSAVVSPGVVRIAGDRQTMQAPVTGTLSAVHVRNGQKVVRGQILAEFIPTDQAAREGELAARIFALEAEKARIEAEQLGQARVAMPAAFAALDPERRADAERALRIEQAELDAQRTLAATQQDVLRERSGQVGAQIGEYRQRLASSRQQTRYSREELGMYEDLLAKGLATRARVLALKRAAAAAEGDSASVSAEIARLNGQGGETRIQMAQLRSERAQHNAERLRLVTAELQSLLPQWRVAKAQLAQTVIRAPVSGTIVAKQMPVRGAVVGVGSALLDVVPSDGALSVESRISLAEANEVRPGQVAHVRLSAASGRMLAPLDAMVERVSADSIEDEKTGATFYTATVRISREQVAAAVRHGNLVGGVRAGTPVQVTIPIAKRSAFEYLIGPLTGRLSRAFVEN